MFRRDFTARRAGGPAAVNRVTDGHMQTLPSRELKIVDVLILIC